MRIVSLNAWGGALYEPLLAWLPRSAADVLCLQEVTRIAGQDGWTHFADGERSLPQRANLFEDVRASLPRHQPLFLASDAGPVTTADGRERRQDFGIAVFVDERLPVVAHDSLFIHGAFTDHERWPTADRPRVAHGLRVVDRIRGRTVSVVHLHGLRDPGGKGDTPARRAQAERLVQLVTRLRQPADLTVVVGDLNLLPHSETFDVLAEIGLVDLVRSAETRTSLYSGPTRHADYLLVSDPHAVRSFRVLAEPEVSDHRPLVLDV